MCEEYAELCLAYRGNSILAKFMRDFVNIEQLIALSEKLTVLPARHTAYIALNREELQKFNHKTGDTEGLVNYALSIEGIRFAALFTERENKIRISFRSVGEFSVNEFARNHFLGGGHRNAAGGDSFEDMDQTLSRFKRLLQDYKADLR